MCAECRARRALRQRRTYSDDSLRLNSSHYLFPPRELQSEDTEEKTPVRRVPLIKRTQLRRPAAWGLGAENDGTTRARTPDAVDETRTAEERQVALWEQFERAEETDMTQAQEQKSDLASALSTNTSRDEALLDIDYTCELSQALLDNAPDKVARCLFAAARRDDLEFVRGIPTLTFAECIRMLQPCNFTEKLAHAHLEISEAQAKAFGVTSMKQVAWEHSNLLKEILAIRRSAGIRLGLAEYRVLLRSARDLGNKKLAGRLWSNLLDEGHTPDTACYNFFMAAVVWDGIHDPVARHRVRVIPFNLTARRHRTLGRGFGNYRVGDGGVKGRILKVFGEMLKHGAVADEESFRNVITVAAREGDVATVKAVLRRVWDIDVDALHSAKDEASINLKAVEKISLLRPTSKLLFTLAHAFGINNDVPTALRLVDFVARRYDIHIDLETWGQLFEWTFVLATPRTGVRSRTDGSKTGQLPKQSVLNLWDTMIGPPYSVKPTIGMYNHLIKNMQHRDWSPMLFAKMREGLELFYESRRYANTAFRKLKTELERHEQSSEQHRSTPLESLRREWEYRELIRRRNLFWVKRWVRLLLSTMRAWYRVDKTDEWTLQHLPRILWAYRSFAPRRTWYETRTGVVELSFRSDEEIVEIKRSKENRAEEVRGVLEQVPLFIGEEWIVRSNKGERPQWSERLE